MQAHAEVKREAVANASAQLSNVGLPDVHALAAMVKALAIRLEQSDLGGRSADLLDRAQQMVRSLDGLTGAERL